MTSYAIITTEQRDAEMGQYAGAKTSIIRAVMVVMGSIRSGKWDFNMDSLLGVVDLYKGCSTVLYMSFDDYSDLIRAVGSGNADLQRTCEKAQDDGAKVFLEIVTDVPALTYTSYYFTDGNWFYAEKMEVNDGGVVVEMVQKALAR